MNLDERRETKEEELRINRPFQQAKNRELRCEQQISISILEAEKFIYSNLFTHTLIIETYSNYIFRVFPASSCGDLE